MGMESKKATEAALIELGHRSAQCEIDEKRRKLKITLLKQRLDLAKEFDHSNFAYEHLNTTSEKERNTIVADAANHLQTWKETYDYQCGRIEKLKKENVDHAADLKYEEEERKLLIEQLDSVELRVSKLKKINSKNQSVITQLEKTNRLLIVEHRDMKQLVKTTKYRNYMWKTLAMLLFTTLVFNTMRY